MRFLVWKNQKVKQLFDPKKQLIRMSWDKYNLYNLAQRTNRTDISRGSVYQQRFTCKREVRSYHGNEICERQFLDRHFNTKLPTQLLTRKEREQTPPIQALMFAELERRLDVVIFRSHFASSDLQARSHVVRGHVKVNGVKCIHPSRRLEDGDIVTVSPSVVPTLKATNPEQPNERSFAPVPFMGPFMFIPEYLEVDYNTCSTVFLRSPLPQPNAVEIPSPHPPQLHQLAFEWYARRYRAKTRVAVKAPLVINGKTVRLKPKFDRIIRREQQLEAQKRASLSVARRSEDHWQSQHAKPKSTRANQQANATETKSPAAETSAERY
ncbi:uncharacterized protein BJ171DRAFT_487014 [Polychytrium aggregatum]|uniref:uncharacterized protein n=1 Tax=Polychytrium aggregatum TaxID=110093 RepID=UPI0022FDDBC3|nr:uncharacterized protein BJ171DRAFT_487014 [Polychytrium aggregatum]KAI9209449.1 hypothetical protein BJ171DRAFT_487014 [Polychytrium aggregatum]